MQTRYSDKKAVRLSVCLYSVCLSVKRVDCDKIEVRFIAIFYTIRKNIWPSFLRRRIIGGGDPLYLKFWVNWPPLERNRRFSTDIRP